MLELIDSGVELDVKHRTGLATPDVHDILTRLEVQMATNNWLVSSSLQYDCFALSPLSNTLLSLRNNKHLERKNCLF